MSDDVVLNITASSSIRRRKKATSYHGLKRFQRIKKRRHVKQEGRDSIGEKSKELGKETSPNNTSVTAFTSSDTTAENRTLEKDKVKHVKEIQQKDDKKSVDTPTDTTDNKTTKTDTALPKQNERKRKISDSHGKAPKQQKTIGQGQSSLFRNNPDIPTIQRVEVNQLNETVFSKRDFSELPLHPHMIANLEKNGFNHATSVQRKTIPHILEGADVMIKSQTGSGKTLAYAIPIVEMLQSIRPKIQRLDGTHAIVIVPTRELAIQSTEILQKLIYPFSWLVPGSLMGGEKKKSEKARIRKGITILVSTPGRLIDHLENTKNLSLDKVSMLVIDEADRLLDMGFEREVSKIMSILKEKAAGRQQTILLSATLTAGVERLAGMSLKTPVRVDVSKTSSSEHAAAGSQVLLSESDVAGSFATPDSLKHNFIVVPSKVRLVTLAAFLLWKCKYSNKRAKAVVFFSTQDSVEFHHHLFQNQLVDAKDDDSQDEKLQLFKLHGEMPQKERSKTFSEYSATTAGILFCTDVAARGLDFPHVRWIIQYNTPGSPKDYIHRAGRTARIGSQGRALVFLHPSEVDYVNILNGYKINLSEIKMEEILQILLLEKKELLLTLPKGEIPRSVQECSTALHFSMENYVQNNPKVKTMATKAYRSFIRSYATYPKELKGIFHVKKLHLGHVAKSFCIHEAPSKIEGVNAGHNKSKFKRGSRDDQRTRPNRGPRNFMNVSEFSDGLKGAITSNKRTHKD